jgi:Tetratricopeptide repeat
VTWRIEQRVISNDSAENGRPAILKEFVFLLSPTVTFLTRQALFGDVEGLVKLTISSSEMANGPEHPDKATALCNLCSVYASQGDFEGAEQYGRQALAIRKAKFGPKHENTIITTHPRIYLPSFGEGRRRNTTVSRFCWSW